MLAYDIKLWSLQRMDLTSCDELDGLLNAIKLNISTDD